MRGRMQDWRDAGDSEERKDGGEEEGIWYLKVDKDKCGKERSKTGRRQERRDYGIFGRMSSHFCTKIITIFVFCFIIWFTLDSPVISSRCTTHCLVPLRVCLLLLSFIVAWILGVFILLFTDWRHARTTEHRSEQ